MQEIESALKALVGARLSLAHYAGNMRIFHFGEVEATEAGLVGQYAIHIQCPWRIEHYGQTITGSRDWYEPADGFESIADVDSWDPARGGSLQENRLRALFQSGDDDCRTLSNRTDHLVVLRVDADPFGGCQIGLSGGYQLSIFPCASRGEEWRLLQPGKSTAHLVVAAMK
jgi:hypothetical protein